ncbi:MAG TPA: polyprenyl synthetase family protein [Candidatus Nealsonbacteria bacterium]|nr:polyprenyl synthetase family protein [Candidatus Nealsonbacteria bacterium]HEB46539.1 polyprenyl synthetase family protein [Candidatus Nealsonbacteria bacterium]
MSSNFKKEKLKLILLKMSKLVEPTIRELLSSRLDKKTQEISNYQILTGGKRLRPALAIISCQLLGGKVKDVLYPAASLEILHNYTLIVDDMIDNGVLRRGRPTLWVKFGQSIAQCITIDYAAFLFQGAIRSREPIKISELLAETIQKLVDGEILDILFEQTGRTEEPYVAKNRYKKITEKDYLKMVSNKTASLFQTSCEIGGICAGAKKEKINALKKYGFNLGMAFQIQDDILDIFGEEKAFGKKVGKDIEERKGGNIIILFTLKELNSINKKKLLKILRKKGKITKRDIKETISLIKKTNSYQKASSLGISFSQRAKNALRNLPQNEWNIILKNLADFTVVREK